MPPSSSSIMTNEPVKCQVIEKIETIDVVADQEERVLSMNFQPKSEEKR